MKTKRYHKITPLVRGDVKKTPYILLLLCFLFLFASSLFAKKGVDLSAEYFSIAEAYSEVKKYEKAIEFYKKAEKDDAYANAAAYNIGRMYALLKMWHEALATLKPLYEKEPTNEKLLCAYAYALVANGSFEEGEVLYKQIYENNKESPQAAFDYTRLLIVAKKYDDAKAMLETLKEQFIEDEERKTIENLTNTIEKLLEPLKDEKKKEEEEEKNEKKEEASEIEDEYDEEKMKAKKEKEEREKKLKEEKEKSVKEKKTLHQKDSKNTKSKTDGKETKDKNNKNEEKTDKKE